MSNSGFVSPNQMIVSREGVKLRRQGGLDIEPVHEDFAAPKKVVLLVHGFTASAENMSQLADFLQSAGFTVINCTYPCFKGIDEVAKAITARLAQYAQVIESNRVSIVAHSMGGLVARAIVSMCSGNKYIRGVITLGTPHLGTLKDRRVLNLILSLMEFVKTTPFTGAYFPESRSGKQLICADEEGFIEKLWNAPAVPGVQWVSLSGGMRYLEFGSNWFKNTLANWYIQRSFEGLDNDGLVQEDSASSMSATLASCMPGAAHIGKNFKGFDEHKDINHTSLVNCGWVNVEVLKRLEMSFA
jgi:pimeloyl-ACP methyl ester carboxylesterase